VWRCGVPEVQLATEIKKKKQLHIFPLPNNHAHLYIQSTKTIPIQQLFCIVVMGVKVKSRGRGYQTISQKFVSVTSK
jgi:hypothetical protein